MTLVMRLVHAILFYVTLLLPLEAWAMGGETLPAELMRKCGLWIANTVPHNVHKQKDVYSAARALLDKKDPITPWILKRTGAGFSEDAFASLLITADFLAD